MMIQPFLCAAILAGVWHWTLLPAAAAVLGAFLLREPLVVMGRQRFVWTTPHEETGAARRWLGGLLGGLAASGVLLAMRWPWPLLALFGGLAMALTALAVVLTVKNRQRSWWLQVLSAAGLSASCFAATLSALGTIPDWCWWVWLVSTMHALAGILVVHARLEARIAAKTKKATPPRFRIPAAAAAATLLMAAIACALLDRPILAAALALSATVHAWGIWTLSSAKSMAMPLMKVGLRAMTLSIVVSILMVAGLWSEA